MSSSMLNVNRNLPSSIKDSFPGTTSLFSILNKKVMVVLRDNKKFIGTLRSYDQYGNIFLHETVERIYIGTEYGEQFYGVYLIRGENIQFMGEVLPNEPLILSENFTQRPMIEMLQRQKEFNDENKRIAKLKRQLQRKYGLLEAEMIADLDI